MAILVEQEQEKGLGRQLRTPGCNSKRGASRFGPLLLVLPLAFAFGFALRALRGDSPVSLPGESLSERDAALLPDVHATAEVDGFGASLDLPGGQLKLRLAPLEPVQAVQEFIADSWGTRLGLGEGEPWRLDLQLSEETSEPLSLIGLLVEDEEGLALSSPTLSEVAGDPRAALLRPRRAPLAPGHRREVVLWGRPPGVGARLVFGEREIALESVHYQAGELPRWLAAPARTAESETGDPENRGKPEEPRAAEEEAVGPKATEESLLEDRVAQLEGELQALRARRVERELAWYEYNRALADLNIDALVAAFAVDEELLRENDLVAEAGTEEGTGDDDLDGSQSQRDLELERGVRSLLALEGFFGLDLLELGPPQGAAGAGPAIFRMLDDRGRLLGSLNARLLRLEASRSARTITLVLEDGYESRGGKRVPFAGGARRLLIPYVDPGPWIEALPELFGEAALNTAIDDGLWQLEPLRRELNRLLALETSGGWWRLQGIGGVLGDTLRDVQLEQLDSDGRTRRRIFADRLRILLEDPGLLMILEDGAILRGSKKTPFVDGSYRLFLPRAPLEEWRAADIPKKGA